MLLLLLLWLRLRSQVVVYSICSMLSREASEVNGFGSCSLVDVMTLRTVRVG